MIAGALAGFTIVADDLDAILSAYAGFLAYRAESVTRVSAAQAARWRAPALQGRRQAILRPASRHHRFLRFVEHRQAEQYRPLCCVGWNAIELVVRDLDALARTLADSPFQVIGPPATVDLGFTDRIRAMQVVGPAGEVLYLTEIGGEIPGFALPEAACAVDCAFVAVLGVRSIEVSGRFHAALAGAPAGPVLSARIGFLSEAHGIPVETRHALATVPLPAASLIEIDAYPPTALARPPTPSGLPAGIGIASFAAPAGAASRLLVGPDQEWIELLAEGDPG